MLTHNDNAPTPQRKPYDAPIPWHVVLFDCLLGACLCIVLWAGLTGRI